MEKLHKGKFYGQTNERRQLEELTLTDTEYIHDKVDWHYHETPYFTFILEGDLIEGNKKEIYHCSPGTLLFHNWQEAHYNIKPKGYTRGFHVELDEKWISRFDVNLNELQGSIHIDNPIVKLLFYKIFRESKNHDDITPLSIQTLLLETLSQIESGQEINFKNKPGWVKKIRDILHDSPTRQLSLDELSNLLHIHPVHLSRDFSKYFHCTIGEYVRKIRVGNSLMLLSNKNLSLTEIGFACGFADQSHFIRCFKKIMGTSPLVFRKQLLR
jgi:AraC-like DNA-binding protein